MIETTTVNGRPAQVAYIDAQREPVTPDKATLIKVRFIDEAGGIVFLQATPLPVTTPPTTPKGPHVGDYRWGHAKRNALARLKQTHRAAIARAQAAQTLARLREREWDEGKHPRVPAGSPDGGQFGSGGAGDAPKPKEPPQGELFPGKFPPVPDKTPVVEGDFKDKVKLGANMTTSQKQEFLKTWAEKVQEAPEAFRQEFMGGLDGTMTIGVDSGGAWQIGGNIHDANGRSIGIFTREIDFEANSASSSYFKLNAGQTGKDVGKKLLAANVAKYQELGLDSVEVHANIDVGGYAWAKYGYVPTEDSWSDLTSTLYDKLGGAGSGYVPESWEELSSDQQDEIKDAWKRDTRREFLDSEIEHWRESGGALDDAKAATVDGFDPGSAPIGHWSWKTVQKWRQGRGPDAPPLTVSNDEILAATTMSYERDGEGRNDPDITVETVEGLSEDDRADIEAKLVSAFNDEAEKLADDIEPPSHLEDNLDEHQNDIWDSMSDGDKYSFANDNNLIGEAPAGDGLEIDSDDAADVRSLLDSGDPKAIWSIADSSAGKDMLLGTDWSGVLNLHDKETMDRFNAYVGKKAG